MKRRLIMVVNDDRFFLSHRKTLGLSAQNAGWSVFVVCKNTGAKDIVESLGLSMIDMPINPTGMNPFQELRTFWFLYRLYIKLQPDVVHHIGVKNILWGGLAARLARINGIINAVCGLGVLFSKEPLPFIPGCILKILKFCNQPLITRFIFQNKEDYQMFLDKGVVAPKQCLFIKGSGVNLQEYSYTPESQVSPLRVIFTARMVKEKGVLTLIEAAELLRPRFEGKVEFLLCGDLSNNPKGIKKEELESLCDGKYIKWLGYRTDIPQLLQSSHIVAFPSYYREGVPRSLIEACAVGRPIITCRSIGCKDVVDDGVNGYLINPKDSSALASRLEHLLEDQSLRITMGCAGREKAEREFDIHQVEKDHLECYNSLINK